MPALQKEHSLIGFYLPRTDAHGAAINNYRGRNTRCLPDNIGIFRLNLKIQLTTKARRPRIEYKSPLCFQCLRGSKCI